MDGQNPSYGSSNLFGDNPQFNSSLDQYFNATANGPQFNDSAWAVNSPPVEYNPLAASRAQQQHPSQQPWHQHQPANHLVAPSPNPTSSSSFSRSPAHSPVSFAQNNYAGFPANAQRYSGYQEPRYDTAFAPQSTQATVFSPGYHATNNIPAIQSSTVAPQALDYERVATQAGNPNFLDRSYPPSATWQQPRPHTLPSVDQRALAAAVPSGGQSGSFTLISYDALAKSTNSERLSNFANIGVEALEWPVNRASLPAYIQRRSKNELRRLATNNPALLEKLGKKTRKDAKIYGSSDRTGVPARNVSAIDRSTGSGSSSSEESSSDDDSSAYSSSEDEAGEPAPIPPKRPENAKEAVEFDVIKALWRPKRRPTDQNSVRKGIVDFWDVVKTIRDRWKSDKEAADTALEKSSKADPVLAGRVKDQRDMVEVAFKTALKHGHKGVVEYMGENKPLDFLCYQFLLDRFKAEEMNGPLARAVLETLSLFTTLTEDTLEKTHLIKILPRYEKKGDAKSKFWAKKIQQNAAAATREQAKQSGEHLKGTLSGGEKAAGLQTKKSPATQQVVGQKRSATSTDGGGSSKKVATGEPSKSTIAQPTSNKMATSGLKKPGVSKEAQKTASPNANALASKPKTVVAKPTGSSGFFSGLQSASKKSALNITAKPGMASAARFVEKKVPNIIAPVPASKPSFSFAETMANLTKPKDEKHIQKAEKVKEKEQPAETPEQKARRLKKESRRHLHVSFKAGDDLVQIRYFTHDPDEELGHDSSQMRDVSDVGGEGRMFKQQHQQMELDEDEDVVEEEVKLSDFREPSPIDFSIVDQDERKRNFEKFGGGEQRVDTPERSARELYESNNLMAVYTNSSDIPSNPKEPADIQMTGQGNVLTFGTPPSKFELRGRDWRRKLGSHGSQTPNFTDTQHGNAYGRLGLLDQTAQALPSHQPPQTQQIATPDLSNILAALQRSSSQMANQPPAATSQSSGSYPQPTQNSSGQATQPPPNFGQLDIASIMQQLQQSSQQQKANVAPSAGLPGTSPLPFVQSSGFQPTLPTPGNTLNTFEDPQRMAWHQGSEDLSKKREENPFYKTKLCKYWREGKCTRGVNCSYLHEDA